LIERQRQATATPRAITWTPPGKPLYRAPEAPAVPQLPPELAYIWTWFTS